MMDCAILINLHPMIGCDYHDTWPPGSPAPSPAPTPHFVMQILNGLSPLLGDFGTVKKSPSVESNWFPPILRGSDIGMFLPHVGANMLIPLIYLTSGSVSEFGAFTVHMDNGKNGSGAVAVAFPGKYATINLNCQGPALPPLALPTGIVIAPSTNFAGFKLGDLLASLLVLAADILISFIANKLGGALTKGLGNLIGNVASRFLGPRFIIPLVYLMTKHPAGTVIGYVAEAIIGVVVVGSPIGYDAPTTVLGNTYGRTHDDGTKFLDETLQGIADHYNNPNPDSPTPVADVN